MTQLGKYFEKKRGVIWAIITVTLFLFAFGGFDLIFKFIYVEIDFQNSSLKGFQAIVSKDLNFSKFCVSNFFLLVIAFTTVVLAGLLVWAFTRVTQITWKNRALTGDGLVIMGGRYRHNHRCCDDLPNVREEIETKADKAASNG